MEAGGWVSQKHLVSAIPNRRLLPTNICRQGCQLLPLPPAQQLLLPFVIIVVIIIIIIIIVVVVVIIIITIALAAQQMLLPCFSNYHLHSLLNHWQCWAILFGKYWLSVNLRQYQWNGDQLLPSSKPSTESESESKWKSSSSSLSWVNWGSNWVLAGAYFLSFHPPPSHPETLHPPILPPPSLPVFQCFLYIFIASVWMQKMVVSVHSAAHLLQYVSDTHPIIPIKCITIPMLMIMMIIIIIMPVIIMMIMMMFLTEPY